VNPFRSGTERTFTGVCPKTPKGKKPARLCWFLPVGDGEGVGRSGFTAKGTQRGQIWGPDGFLADWWATDGGNGGLQVEAGSLPDPTYVRAFLGFWGTFQGGCPGLFRPCSHPTPLKS